MAAIRTAILKSPHIFSSLRQKPIMRLHFALLPAFCLILSGLYAQKDTLDLSSNVTSILINWSWQAQNGDTTMRDFCLLEFALPAEALTQAYGFRLADMKAKDDKGREYFSNAFAVTAGEQTFHRDYRLLAGQKGQGPAPHFRVRIENPKRDIEYFSLEGVLEAIDLSRDPNSVLEFSTMDWQPLYEALLPQGIQLVFAAESRGMIEQMANQGSMSPEGQESLNSFLETNSLMLRETLFPGFTNFLLLDADKRLLKVETIGADGIPIPYKDNRSYSGGVLQIEQQYEALLSGREKVRVIVATPETQLRIPVKVEKLLLPW